MQSKHKAPLDVVATRRHRPGRWAQLPWTLLGVMFIVALVLSSQRIADTVPNPVPGHPAGSPTRLHQTDGHPAGRQ